MKTAAQIYYVGRVQGVGFRYTVKRIASGYEVTGWVRNLPDGRVEVQVGGDHTEMDAFLRAIADSHLSSFIKETHCQSLELTSQEWTGFDIQS